MEQRVSENNGSARRESLENAAARILRGNAEKDAQSLTSGVSVSNNHGVLGSFSLDDFVIFFTTEIIALPWGFHAPDAWTKGDYVSSIGTYAFCIPVGLLGLSFHWWKSFVGASIRDWVLHESKRWWPLALMLAFIYFLGPDIYNRLLTGPPPIQVSNSSSPGDTNKPLESPRSSLSLSTSNPLTSEDIVTKIDIWKSIDVQMNHLSRSLTMTYTVLTIGKT
jgi:hypothetical protein